MTNDENRPELTKLQKYRQFCQVAFKDGECTESTRKMLDMQAEMLELTPDDQKQIEAWFYYKIEDSVSEKDRYKFLLKELKENESLNILEKENVVKKLREIQLPESEKLLLEKEILSLTLENFTGFHSADEGDSKENFDSSAVIKAINSKYKEGNKSSDASLKKIKDRIKKVLCAYNVRYKNNVEILAEEGPTVIRFSLELEEGESIGKIQARINDITRELGAPKTVSVANVPGTFKICFDVPKGDRFPIPLVEFLKSNRRDDSESLEVGLGMNTSGKMEKIDLLRTRHLLVGGTTGSGKSVLLQSLIISLISQYSPRKLKLIIVDPKQLDFTMFEGLPHLEPFGQVTYKTSAADNILNELIKVIDKRKNIIKGKALNVAAYNEMVNEDERIPYVVVVIDEYADFLMSFKDKKSRNELEQKICRIAQVSRALGIRLILATQRPEANIVTGLIKANFPARIALTVRNHVNSTMILDASGAENLLGNGDMLYSCDGSSPMRLQGFFIDNQELNEAIQVISSQCNRGKPLFSGDIGPVLNPFEHLVLPIHHNTPLTLRPDEIAFLHFDAVFQEAQNIRVSQGPRWHLGLGKSVSKGTSIRGGVSFGKTKSKNKIELGNVDTGYVVFTNQRIVFLGAMHAEECKYFDIIDYLLGKENLVIYLRNRRKAMCFTFSGDIFVNAYMDEENPELLPQRTSKENIDIILKTVMYLSHDPGLDYVNFNKYEGCCVTSIPRG